MRRRIRSLSFFLLVCLAASIQAQDLGPGGPIPDRTSLVWLVRSISTSDRDIPHPSGLAFSDRKNTFLVLGSTSDPSAPAPHQETLALLTPLADRAGSLILPMQVSNALGMTVDGRTHKLLALDEGGRVLIEARLAPAAPLRQPRRYDVSHFGIQDPQGMAVDPRTGTLYVLDALSPHIVRIEPDRRRPGAAHLANGRATHMSLGATDAPELRGLAFNPVNGHLYILSPSIQRLFELTAEGEAVAFFDLSSISLATSGAMVFAPSGDSTDDPREMSLYITDAGLPDGTSPGRIVELSLDPPQTTQVAPFASTFRASLVRTIDASRFSPPSPDCMGLAYDASTNSLVMTDSEVEEMSLYAGVNVFELSFSGAILRTSNTRSFSDEPAGVAIDSARGLWYISDDDKKRVFVIDIGSDRRFKTSDDRVTSFSTTSFGDDDPEGISFDPVTKHLFLVSGLQAEVYEVSPGSNGRFEGSDDQLIRHWDTDHLGLRDPETLEVNPDSQTLYIASRGSTKIIETTYSGTVVREIDKSVVSEDRPSGMAYAPASSGSGMHLYIADRGADNDGNSRENDGKIFEITLPASGTPPSGGGGGGGAGSGILVAASSDDAEESSSGSVSLSSSDLELVFDGNNQVVGLRFNGLAIPRGATIGSAYIQFHADETQSETTHLTIFGQNVDNAPTFLSSSGNVSSRARTSASVTWDPPAWSSIGEAGATQKTSNLGPILQEIVGRSGWSSGNSVAFIFTGTGHRTAVALDGNPSQAPMLFVEVAVSNQAPSVSAGSNQTVTLLGGATLNGTVSDDGLPIPPGRTTVSWTPVSGPGVATFGDDAAIDTTASFSAAGTYILRLSATDGDLSRNHEVTIEVTDSSGSGSGSIEARVRSSSDDAEEESSGTMALTSSDLELILDGSKTQTVGLRFTGLTIPRGATIVNAYVQFTVDEAQSTSTSLTIQGQAADSGSSFSSSANSVSSRSRTSASVGWSPVTWSTIGEAGSDQRTPDLKAVVQEIVNRSGWSPGNSLVLIITGTGHRTAVAFDGTASKAPLLHVAYQ